MRIAVFRENGKLLGEFLSEAEAARVLNVSEKEIVKTLTRRTQKTLSPTGPQKKLGRLLFREIDNEKKYVLVGRS